MRKPPPDLTPSQTIGPFFAYGLTAQQYGYGQPQVAGADLLAEGGDGIEGERLALSGTVFDGEGVAVDDALIEIWQADAQGRYASTPAADGAHVNAHFTGFGRCGTGAPAGTFTFLTIKPGLVSNPHLTVHPHSTINPGTVGAAAPHITVIVFARGLLSHLITRAYFDDEATANACDPTLLAVDPARRDTLIARRRPARTAPDRSGHDASADGPTNGHVARYQFDIHLSGPRETVFFDL
ncbi:MAG: protocatechuate 3,4-dioxygenase subunit alpha [Pseudomonadota bacterium]